MPDPDHTPADPSGGREPETVTELLAHWGDEGITASFRPGSDPGSLLCPVCESTRAAHEFDVIVEQRLEGESDPDDMVLAVAARCPVCHISGSIVLGFGMEASEADSDIVADLPKAPR